MKIVAAGILAYFVLIAAAPVAAEFEFIEEVFLSSPMPFAPFTGVAFDGEEYLTARWDGSVVRYDATFNLIETFDIPAPFTGNLRSLDIDRENGNLLALSNTTRILTEFTPDLELVHEYSTIQPDLTATSDVVLDPVTNTTWAAGVFTGLVTQYTREGEILSNFQTEIVDSFNTIAIDWVNRTILLFDPLPDRLVEYTLDGEFVGTPFPAVAGDFFGLGTGFTNGIYYDSETARLYAISNTGDLAIWEDLSRLILDGDYNQDGLVDAADFTVWQDSLGLTGSGLAADGDGNGVIDMADYSVWVSNFGNSQNSGIPAPVANVPEPATWSLLGWVAILIGGLNRLRRRS